MNKYILRLFFIFSLFWGINSINNVCMAMTQTNQSTQTISYYADYPSIPDFKTVTNISGYECGYSYKGFCYDFDNKKFEGHILLDKYAKVLENVGLRADKNKWDVYTSSWNGKVENNTNKIVFYDDKNNLIVTAEEKTPSAESIDYKARTKTLYFGQSYIFVQVGEKTVEPYKDANGKMTCGDGYEYVYTMMGSYCNKTTTPAQTTPNNDKDTNNSPKTKKSIIGDVVTGIGAGALMLLMGK